MIQPISPLPALTSGDTTIDGYSQSGATPAAASSFSATIDVTTVSFVLPAFFTHPYLTATARDAGEGTSGFSPAFEAPFRTILIPLALR